ncbi:MAG: helix-turn-helix domain-containing protein [Planctomycetota bacterium]
MPDAASDPSGDSSRDPDIGLRLAAAHRRADRLFNQAYRHLDISNAHAQILHTVLDFGEMRIVDIARRTGLEASTVGRLAKELGRRRLLKRRADPRDARARMLSAGSRAHDLRTELDLLREGVNRRLRALVAGPDEGAPSKLADTLDRLEDLP